MFQCFTGCSNVIKTDSSQYLNVAKVIRIKTVALLYRIRSVFERYSRLHLELRIRWAVIWTYSTFDLKRYRARDTFASYCKCLINHKIRCSIFFNSLLQSQLPAHHHQHRHSLTTRKVHRTRSSGATHHIFDDPMLEVCTQFRLYIPKTYHHCESVGCMSEQWNKSIWIINIH